MAHAQNNGGKKNTDIRNNSTGGRPGLNEEYLLRLLNTVVDGKPVYSTSDIARQMKADPSSIRRYRRKFEKAGQLTYLNEVAAVEVLTIGIDFADECRRAMGESFEAWMKNDCLAYRQHFNFCQKVWVEWGKPSLIMVSDPKSNLGKEVCQKFLDKYGQDKPTIRRHKKRIRYLFRFLNRMDLCDRYLRMNDSRDPREIRRIEQLTLMGFPKQLDAAIEEMVTIYGADARTFLRLKICSGMRTGALNHGYPGDDRGILGMRKGSTTSSYLFISEDNEVRMRIREKRGEEYNISWIPVKVRDALIKIYKSRDEGDTVFKFNDRFIGTWKEVSKKHVGVALSLHDLRKVSITWLYAHDIPLENAVEINVGWKDLNTAKTHYLHYGENLKRTRRAAYRAEIPSWYGDGLDEYSWGNK